MPNKSDAKTDILNSNRVRQKFNNRDTVRQFLKGALNFFANLLNPVSLTETTP